MVIDVDKLKDVCKDLLYSIDTSSTTVESSLIAISLKEGVAKLEITNREYYVSNNISVDISDEDFYAVVKADLFLRLIPKLTTKQVELKLVNNSLEINSNGKYNLPLIYEGDTLINIPIMDIENVTTTFNIDTEILRSIFKYNSIELQKKNNLTSPLHQLFYIDEKGCITYNTGACVNSFEPELPNPIRLVVNEKIVRLFKLFKSDVVEFSMGFNPISDKVIQTRIKLQDNITTVVAITSINDLVNQFPTKQIRDRVEYNYPYNMVVDRLEVLQSIDRLSLFNDEKKLYLPIRITKDSLIIFDTNSQNHEDLPLLNNVSNLNEDYSCKFKLSDLEVVLKSCVDKYLTIKFGNHQAIVIDRKTVKNILPEVIGD